MQVDTSNNRDIATAFGNKHNLQNNKKVNKKEVLIFLKLNDKYDYKDFSVALNK